jgi:RHS repeat-associated protein
MFWVANSGELWYGTIQVSSAYPPGAVESGAVFVPRTPESFSHDADGNLTHDDQWVYTWDLAREIGRFGGTCGKPLSVEWQCLRTTDTFISRAEENRLVLIESAAGVPSGARMREAWAYLPDGRWIERIVSTNNGSSYYPAWTNRYVWDGQVLLAILDHTNGLVMSFVRGLDLSGTIQGAGGVGGVLAVTFKTNGTHFVCYDGNGNVTALTDAATGANSAVFEYGPFGEPLRVTGPAAVAMPLRFSTMYEDEVTGDRKYLFREYRPSLGRWLSRDPIGDEGFWQTADGDVVSAVITTLDLAQPEATLYGLVWNNAVNEFDYLGLMGPGSPPNRPPQPPPPRPPGGDCPFIDYGEVVEWHYINRSGVWLDKATMRPATGDPLDACRASPCSKGTRFCEAYYMTFTPSVRPKPGPTPSPTQPLPFPVFYADVAGRCGECDKSCRPPCTAPFFCGKVVHSTATRQSRVVWDQCECRSQYD